MNGPQASQDEFFLLGEAEEWSTRTRTSEEVQVKVQVKGELKYE